MLEFKQRELVFLAPEKSEDGSLFTEEVLKLEIKYKGRLCELPYDEGDFIYLDKDVGDEKRLNSIKYLIVDERKVICKTLT